MEAFKFVDSDQFKSKANKRSKAEIRSQKTNGLMLILSQLNLTASSMNININHRKIRQINFLGITSSKKKLKIFTS